MSEGMPVYAKALASELPADWRVAPFEDFVFFQEGPGIRNWQYVDRGVPFVNIRCLVDGRLDRSSMSSVASEEAFGKYRHFLLDADDYVVSSSGTLGRIATVHEEDLPCMLNTSVVRMRPQGDQLDSRYLKYFLLSSYYQTQIKSFATGSAQLNYGPSHLRQMFIVAPPLDEQRAIAGVLGALDDKIEQNRRTARLLERLARAIFRAWFVDFEPIKAKAAGATAFPGMHQSVFDALPTRFSDSAMGPVPEGWEVTAIGDVVTAKGGGTPSTKNPEYWDSGEHCWATPKDMSRLAHPVLLDTERHITDAGVNAISCGILPVGTVLMSSRAPVGYLAIAGVPTAINQGFIAMVCDGPLPPTYVLNWAFASLDAIKAHASGTTFPEISKKNFRPLPVVVPTSDVIVAYREAADPLFDLLTACVKESEQIAEIRDFLLPQLLSGAVRIRL
jgi:type I restriction enzyme S subunit